MNVQLPQPEVVPLCQKVDHSAEIQAASNGFYRLLDMLRSGRAIPVEQVGQLATFWLRHAVPGDWWAQYRAVVELLWGGILEEMDETCPGCGEAHEAGWLSRIV